MDGVREVHIWMMRKRRKKLIGKEELVELVCGLGKEVSKPTKRQ